MFVRYANKVFIWTKAKDSPTNEEYNTSYVTDVKDEHHDIYEKEEDKPPVSLFIKFKIQFTYMLKSYQNTQEKVLAFS